MPENIQITSASVNDIPEIQEVFYRTWLATYPNEKFGVTVDDIEDRFKDRNSEERLAKRREEISSSPNGKMLVAKDNGKVIGVCKLIKNEEYNELQAIYILPGYQGRGIGAALWQEAQKFFDPGKNTIVHVVTYNTNAINFYHKLGFKDTGKRWDNERFKLKSGTKLPEMELIIKK